MSDVSVGRPLDGHQVLCLGNGSRAPAFAGRILRDLGASVTFATDGLEADPVIAAVLGREPVTSIVAIDEVKDVLGRGVDLVVQHGPAAETLRASNPTTNWIELSWVADDEAGGSDAAAQAVAGVAHVVGHPGRAPRWFPHRMGEVILGVNAAGMAVAFELFERQGVRGQVSLADLWAYAAGTNWLLCVPKGIPYVREGRRSPGNGGVYPQRLFRARDGFVTLLCRSTRDWDHFLAGVGNPPWGELDRYRDLLRMAVNYPDEVDALVEAETQRFTRAELFEKARELGFPLAPVRTPEEALEDEYLTRQGFWAMSSDGPKLPASLWRRETWIETPSGPNTNTDAARPSAVERPLNGWRVLDLSWIWAGPMVGSFLGDLGADVIKIEHERRLDNMRLRGRVPRVDGGPDPHAGTDPREIDPLFHNVNRGKRSLLLDLKAPAGRELFLELVRHSDVIVESFRPHVLDAWGLDFETLREVNPKIVLLSLRGLELAEEFGPSGLRSYAPITSSLSGLESTIAYPGDAEPIGGMGVGISDPVAGWHGITFVLAAMLHRKRTGTGGWIRLSQLEMLASTLPEMYLQAQGVRIDPPTAEIIRCSDGDLLASLSRDSRAALIAAGMEQDELGELRAGPIEQVTSVLAEHDVPAWPVLPVEAHTDWPQHVGRRLLETLTHDVVGEEDLYVHGWQLDGSPIAPRQSAPLIGQHTREVLTEVLAMDPSEIDRLVADGVLT